MEFKLTLFNAVTLFIMAFTLLTGVGVARGRLTRNWPFLYYPLILGYWKAFDGALSTWWVLAGALSALLVRFPLLGGRAGGYLRWPALAALVYVFLRGADLVLGGELFYFLGFR